MKAQVNFINQTLTTWSARLLKVLGLTVVAVTLFTVVDAKFDHLRQANSRMPEHMITAEQRMKELDCLTRNIYWEAASEPFEGKVAVAQVTINRTESGQFPSDICQVVYQKNVVYEKVLCQFSWYCDSASLKKPMNGPVYTEAMEVAKKVLLEGFRLDAVKGALYYHADYVNPKWGKKPTAKIGHHIFYH
jgi:spore germination cell wall hydrolase CwlJ-like protein